jgi:abequosyltransferase
VEACVRPKLSICIPTLNRARFLPLAVSSVLEQVEAPDRLEIVISDNASDDDTPIVIDALRSRFPHFRCFRWPDRVSADKNLQKVVELAEGEYCWFLGDDDVLAPGALGPVLSELEEGHGIYVGGRRLCNMEMVPYEDQRPLAANLGRVYQMADPMERRQFFANAQHYCETFEYMSTYIFKKELWDRHNTHPEFEGTRYLHTGVMLNAVASGSCSLKYLPFMLAHARIGNTGEVPSLGVVRGYAAWIDGLDTVVNALFTTGSPERFEISRLRRQGRAWGLWDLLELKSQHRGADETAILDHIARWTFFQGGPKGTLRYLTYRALPRAVFERDRLARGARRWVRLLGG